MNTRNAPAFELEAFHSSDKSQQSKKCMEARLWNWPLNRAEHAYLAICTKCLTVVYDTCFLPPSNKKNYLKFFHTTAFTGRYLYAIIPMKGL